MAHPFGGSGRALAGNRGSRRRLRRIRMRENSTPLVWALLVFVLLILFVGLPWLIRRPPPHEDHVFGKAEREHK